MAAREPDTDMSSVMSRSQPGHHGVRSSSKSIDTDINFQRTTGTERSQLEPCNTRASSRSAEIAINFKRARENQRSQLEPCDARASSRSAEIAINFKRAREQQRTRIVKSTSDVSVYSLDSLFEDHMMIDDDDDDNRSPSPAFSKDSGITGSSGASFQSTETLPEPVYAGPDDVVCDLCTGQKCKAWKSCLTCVRSFCEKHGRDHYKYRDSVMYEHQLVEVTDNLDVYKENAELKQTIRAMEEENRLLREKINSLKQGRNTPSLPTYICRGKTPTAANVILDPDTAHPALVLSTDCKQVRLSHKPKKGQTEPQRFDRWECVLATNGFSSGRHYWHVEVNKEFTVGVMKSTADRKGRFAFAPFQGYWCIFHFWLSFSALENHVVRLPITTVPQVLGVCVDVDERWVTFYNVETKDQIYTFKDMKLAPGDLVYPIFRTVERSVDLQIKSLS